MLNLPCFNNAELANKLCLLEQKSAFEYTRQPY